MRSTLAMILAAAMAVGCSDDENVGQTAPQDSGSPQPDTSIGMDASVDVPATSDGGLSSDAPPGIDGFIDIFDAFAIPDGPIGDCVGCIRDKCGAEVNQCVNNEACRAGLQCALTTCLASGTPDPSCLLGCFMNDPVAIFTAGAALMCVNSKCSAVCAPGGIEGGTLDGSLPPDAPPLSDGAPPSDAPLADTASPESGLSEASTPGDTGGSGD
jgi:hypothetical protein